jgi:FkbM family methyltransferase
MNYSQNQEQAAILKYFEGHIGTFLDLGANDGQTLSNTRALAELGWCGVLVEPSPIAFPKLKKLYESEKKGCYYLYNCAIGLSNGTVPLYESGTLLKTGDTALVSTLVKDETKRFASTVEYTDIECKVYRWKTFLNRLTIKKFDFISIDCEGLDADILDQIDVSDVKCLCIEWNGHEELKQRFIQKMEGFKIIYTSGENLIFATGFPTI